MPRLCWCAQPPRVYCPPASTRPSGATAHTLPLLPTCWEWYCIVVHFVCLLVLVLCVCFNKMSLLFVCVCVCLSVLIARLFPRLLRCQQAGNGAVLFVCLFASLFYAMLFLSLFCFNCSFAHTPPMC